MRRASLDLLRLALPASGVLLGAGADARADQPATTEPAQTRADAPRSEGGHPGYSKYESATIARALARLGATLDPAPDGKIVEAIDVVPFEVFEDRDPAPGFLNWFHVTSWPYVIRREVLLAVGQPYEQALVDETARNLRTVGQLGWPIRP